MPTPEISAAVVISFFLVEKKNVPSSYWYTYFSRNPVCSNVEGLLKFNAVWVFLYTDVDIFMNVTHF